jgi:hypothetical protein
MTYKVWISVEQETEDGRFIDLDLPFASEATFDTEAEATAYALKLHRDAARGAEGVRYERAAARLTPYLTHHNYSLEAGAVPVVHLGGGLLALSIPLHSGGWAWIDDGDETVRIGVYRDGDDEGTIVQIGRPGSDLDAPEWAADAAHLITTICGCPIGEDQ